MYRILFITAEEVMYILNSNYSIVYCAKNRVLTTTMYDIV